MTFAKNDFRSYASRFADEFRKANLAVVEVREIADASSQIEFLGERYPEQMMDLLAKEGLK